MVSFMRHTVRFTRKVNTGTSVVFITDIIQRNPNNHITPMSMHFGDNSHLTGRNVQQIQAQLGVAI